MTDFNPDDCPDLESLLHDLNEDPPIPFCGDDGSPNLNRLNDLGWDDTPCDEVNGLGNSQNCDPMQSGKLRNDPTNPDRNYLFRYTKALRACDEAMLNLFSGMEILDINGKAKKVPIQYATYERAVANLLQNNVRADNSLVTERIVLPVMAIHQTNFDFDEKRFTFHRAFNYIRSVNPDFHPGTTWQEKVERDTVFGVARGIPINVNYELNGWCWYVEEIEQLCEQIMLKFSPIAYINVRGVNWETIVKKVGQANNIDPEVGDKQRVLKFKFNFVAETYIPQPINRKKAVLSIKTDFYNSVDEKEITETIERLEVTVKDLEKELGR